jgi:cytochrome c oxidase cbb3-type subunit IV
MKFIHYLETITGVEVYPLISLLIYFIFFVLLFWYAYRTDKKHFQRMSEIPLTDEPENELTKH